MKQKTNLPERHQPYADKYFLRTKEILEANKLNPWVRAQVFIRDGPGKVYGINESLDILDKYSPLEEHGGRVYSLKEGSNYNSKDTLMVIEAPIQDIIELETMYLGVLTAETTKANDNHGVDLKQVKENMSRVVEAAQGRPVSYFGARHWRYDEDAAITRAAYNGGAISTSTDIGAATFNQEGMGTIPHALENVMAWKYGYKNAVKEATKAFDEVIDPSIPRIALIDYANRELDNSIATAKALDGRLYGVRVDTCGENIAQGAIVRGEHENSKYWFGNGVTISGVHSLRKVLDKNDYRGTRIILTSGFGDVNKVKAFTDAEQELGIKLFDGLGVGGVYKARMATMDIVAVGDSLDNMVDTSKVGRYFTPNENLELMLGGKYESQKAL